VDIFATITSPIAEGLPCGPNPDGDPEFENFIAAAEGLLPTSFFSFSKAGFDAAGQSQRIAGLLEKFRDIRLLVLAGKIAILSGNIEEFSAAVSASAMLLKEQWTLVHPQPIDGDYSLRSAYLSSLDDMPTVVLPLQYAPLANDPRHGAVSYRSHMIATGAAQRRADETALDGSAVRDALINCDLEALKAKFSAVTRVAEAAEEIRARFIDEAGFELAPAFEKLAPLARDMAGLLRNVLSERDASFAAAQAPVSEAGAASGVADKASAVAGLPSPRSMPDASEAMKAIERYYSVHEPSNPAVLLVRQAQLLIGKSFVEAMQSLAPTLMDKATIRVGGETPFALTMAQLKALVGQSSASTAPAAGNGEAKPQEYTVTTRADAAALMEIVEQYYRKQEPSSPIPLLLQRARVFVDRDFSALLKDVLSKPPS
jgi:type VI secretion system protein ImpA